MTYYSEDMQGYAVGGVKEQGQASFTLLSENGREIVKVYAEKYGA